MIKIKHLYNNYYLDRYDKLNYAIYERKLGIKSGKEEFKPIAYHSNLNSLSKSIKERYAKDKLMFSIENDELELLLETLEKVVEKIKEDL